MSDSEETGVNTPARSDRDIEKESEWVRYEGPQGGEGWQHPETGEVRYTDDPPDTTSDATESTESDTSSPDRGDVPESIAEDFPEAREFPTDQWEDGFNGEFPVSPGDEIVTGRGDVHEITEVGMNAQGQPYLAYEWENVITGDTKTKYAIYKPQWDSWTEFDEVAVRGDATPTTDYEDRREEYLAQFEGEWTDIDRSTRIRDGKLNTDFIHPNDRVRFVKPYFEGASEPDHVTQRPTVRGGDPVEGTVVEVDDQSRVVQTDDGDFYRVYDREIREVKRDPDDTAPDVDYPEPTVESRWGDDEEMPAGGRMFRDGLDNLREKYDDETVGELEAALQRWEMHGYTTQYSSVIWHTVCELTGADMPDKVAEYGEEPVNPDVVQACADFIRMDRKAAEERYGETVEVYRGVSSYILEDYAEITEEGIRINPNAMESWSRDQSVADRYAEGDDDIAIKRTFETENVGFLRLGRHSEITMSGHDEYLVPWDDVLGDVSPDDFEKADLPRLPPEDCDWMDELDDAETEKSTVPADTEWIPYEGPQGGQGWQHPQSGEVRYTDDPPDAGGSEPDEAAADDLNIRAKLVSAGVSNAGEATVELLDAGADPSEVATALTDEFSATAQLSSNILQNAGGEVESHRGKPLALKGGPVHNFRREADEKFQATHPSDYKDTVREALNDWKGSMFTPNTAPLFQHAAELTGNETIPEIGETGDESLFDGDELTPVDGHTIEEGARVEIEGMDSQGVVSEYSEPADRALVEIQGYGNVFDHDVDDRQRDAIEAKHEQTTEAFREAFGDTITVFRGISEAANYTSAEGTSVSAKMREAKDRGEAFTLGHRTCESWTTDPDYASLYSSHENGVLLKREIPVERVVAASHTTRGLAYNEFEVIVAHDEEATYDPDQIHIGDADEEEVVEMAVEAAATATTETTEKGTSEAAIHIAAEEVDPHWLHRDFGPGDTTTKSVADHSDWVPYEGPQGGQGWEHPQTGEVRYTDDPPDVAGTDGPETDTDEDADTNDPPAPSLNPVPDPMDHLGEWDYSAEPEEVTSLHDVDDGDYVAVEFPQRYQDEYDDVEGRIKQVDRGLIVGDTKLDMDALRKAWEIKKYPEDALQVPEELRGLDIDITDTEKIPHTDADASRDKKLTDEQQRQLRREFEDRFGKPEAGEVWRQAQEWKRRAYSDDGRVREKTFMEAFDIDGDARNSELEGEIEIEETVEAARIVGLLSRDFVQRTMGDSFEIHRGIAEFAHQDLRSSLFEVIATDEYDSEVEFETNPMTNWTPIRRVADNFGTGTATITAEKTPEDVLCATDAIIGNAVSQENEISCIGNREAVSPDNIDLSGNWNVGEMFDRLASGDQTLDDCRNLLNEFDSMTRGRSGYEKPPEEALTPTAVQGIQRLVDITRETAQRDGVNAGTADFVTSMADDVEEKLAELVEANPELRAEDKAIERTTVDIASDPGSVDWIALSREGTTGSEVTKQSEWERYVGPQGGEGWRNRRTGEIRYQQARPDRTGEDRSSPAQTVGQSSAAWTEWDPAQAGEPEQRPTTNNETEAGNPQDEVTWETLSTGDTILFDHHDGETVGTVTAIEPDFQNPGQEMAWVQPEHGGKKVAVRRDDFLGGGEDIFTPVSLNPPPADLTAFEEGMRVKLEMERTFDDNEKLAATVQDVRQETWADGETEWVVEVETPRGRRFDIEAHEVVEGDVQVEGVFPDDEFAVQEEIDTAPDPNPHIGSERDSLGGTRAVGDGIDPQWKRIQDEAPTDQLKGYLEHRTDKLREDDPQWSEYTEEHLIRANDSICRTIQGILATREDSDIEPTDIVTIREQYHLDDDERRGLASEAEVEDDFEKTIDGLNDHVAAHTLASIRSIEIGPIGDRMEEKGDWIGSYNAENREIKIERNYLRHSDTEASTTVHEIGHAVHYMLGLNYGTDHDNSHMNPGHWWLEFDTHPDANEETEAFYDTLEAEWESMREYAEQEEDESVFLPDDDLNEPLRDYQKTNGNEFFAVAFAHWVNDFNSLLRKQEGVAKAFDEYLGGGREEVPPDDLSDDHIGQEIVFESMDLGNGVIPPESVGEDDVHPSMFPEEPETQHATIVGFEEKEREVQTGDVLGTEYEAIRYGGRHVKLKAGFKEYTVPIEAIEHAEVRQ